MCELLYVIIELLPPLFLPFSSSLFYPLSPPSFPLSLLSLSLSLPPLIFFLSIPSLLSLLASRSALELAVMVTQWVARLLSTHDYLMCECDDV